MAHEQDPNRIGATVSAEDEAGLAALDAVGLTIGSVAYVTSLANSLTLALSSAALVTNQVVAVSGVDGYRWIVNQGAGSVPLTELAPQAAHTFVGNATAGAASPTAMTATQATAQLNAATASLPAGAGCRR